MFEAKFAIFLRTPEGSLPMKHRFMEMSSQEKEVFAMSVVAILQIMGYDPADTGLEMYINGINEEAAMLMSRTRT